MERTIERTDGAVIGDGAMSAGMAFEAMNNAGHLKRRLIVILNDNEMSIAPPVGALSSYLSRLYAGEPFQEFKACRAWDNIDYLTPEMVNPEGLTNRESRESVWEAVRAEPANVPDTPWAPVIIKAVAKTGGVIATNGLGGNYLTFTAEGSDVPLPHQLSSGDVITIRSFRPLARAVRT